MVDGKMVMTGACMEGLKKPMPFPTNKDHNLTETFTGTCMPKKGDI